MYEFIIIGGGITGVTLGRLLQMSGVNNFIILEAESEAGGLCRTKLIDGHYLDIGGGHFLCTKYPQVYDFIFSHIPKEEFNFFDRVSKIRVEGEIIDYPIESNLWQLSTEKQIDYLISAIQAGDFTGVKEPCNYEKWIKWKLGNKIASFYMIPYNKKIWGVEPNELDIDWLHKIPSVKTREILESCLNKLSDRRKMPSHNGFYYPKMGGFQTIFDVIYKNVVDRVMLNEKVIDLEYRDNYWLVNCEYKAKKVINTAPWNHLHKALNVPASLEDCFERLKNNSIVVSLWEQEYNHDWHWCYDPDLSLEYHREFFIHNFAPHSLSTGMYTETNLTRWPGSETSWSNGKKPIVEHINAVAYPVPVVGHSKAISTILEHYEIQNLFGVGRWGQWQYFNSDVCILEAMKFIKAKVL
ncbi:MAG: NAD(P)-binding protein [Microcystis aeruginosa LG13-12]|jgi:protoporphyrinogen oxidase|nr:NAD(P)-binding protein [Microcystis aeruginosa LG13-12]